MKIAETPEIKNYTVVSNRGIRGDRTFLGGFQLGTRMRIFWGSGFLSLLILGAIFLRIDTHINDKKIDSFSDLLLIPFKKMKKTNQSKFS